MVATTIQGCRAARAILSLSLLLVWVLLLVPAARRASGQSADAERAPARTSQGDRPPAVYSDPVFPTVAIVEDVEFGRHVAPLLGKLGCSSAACHGAAEGKGGFRLSLFGYDVAADHAAICRDADGRRVNRLVPAQSLLLLKPTASVPHGGGRRLRPDSWQYEVLRKWIAGGARFSSEAAELAELTISPQNLQFDGTQSTKGADFQSAASNGPSDSDRVSVTAGFQDGSQSDVTPFCDFRVQNDFVAAVDDVGRITARNSGDTAVVATYRGRSAVARILVPNATAGASEDVAAPMIEERSFIDAEIFRKLRLLHITPSPRCGDAEFLRRLSLTTVGRLPTPAEVRRFLADKHPDKRARKIDELLHDPLHSAVWATRFCEILGNRIDIEDPQFGLARSAMWHAWLRRRFAENTPYDRLVKDVLCAVSRRSDDVPDWIAREAELLNAAAAEAPAAYAQRAELDLYWRRARPSGEYPVEEIAERTASAFLGLRIECARCHKHPFDRWTQADYRGFGNIFTQVRYGLSPELRSAMAELLERRRDETASAGKPLPRLTDVFVTDAPHDAGLPGTDAPLPPQALGGPEFAAGGDRRAAFCGWLTENPQFARNLVNRVWAHYFGRGLVEPVDAFSESNPPTHPELLERLADDFSRHGFDFRRLERLILNSTAWQLSSSPNASNLADTTNYARAYVQTLPAEVVWDMLGDALGTDQNLGDEFPPQMRAIEIAPSRVREERLARFFRVFDRPPRERTCDCEQATQPSVRQVMFLMSESALQKQLPGRRVEQLLKHNAKPAKILKELFLATLTRRPSKSERRAAIGAIEQAADKKQAWSDVVWALINTREFITNH